LNNDFIFMIKRSKITKKKIVKQRKNPYDSAKNVLNYLSNEDNILDVYEIGEGGSAVVYFLELLKNTFLFDKIFLRKGKYALKLIYPSVLYLNSKQIEYLTLLSKYGLIPKIYYIDRNTIIMK